MPGEAHTTAGNLGRVQINERRHDTQASTSLRKHKEPSSRQELGKPVAEILLAPLTRMVENVPIRRLVVDLVRIHM